MLILGSVPKGVKTAKAKDANTNVPLKPKRAFEIEPTFMYQLTSSMKMAANGESMRENAKRKVSDAHQHQRDRNDGTAQATCSAAPNREAKTDRKSKLRR